MQRYFVKEYHGEQFEISGEDYHHITRVMRFKENDQLLCSTLDGKTAICTIAEITDETVIANVVKWVEETSELPVAVTIASGLPKGDKLEMVIQKGTELGASMFIPFTAARSIVKWDDKKSAKKVERWQKIAKEAAEQSHRSRIPTVESPISFPLLIQASKSYDYKLIAYEEDAKHGEASVLANVFQQMQEGQSLLVVFGPEGGLTSTEVSQLKENGFQSCGLGPRILRTETAPLYVLSAISYHLELMR
ncbi:16S rRNA (uracil(1498)-N(3))-methyltransferase [Cytobacillus sp. Hz8]|uniref:16S rRNA (uracil(1498)-N(3))-methyltransferase n=1 Tax=Cytobacillus sp. Hz8 TaxID=3347168 RepID=UPI0035E05A7C